MGGLHIEMNLLALLGHWLEGSGWVCIMASANVTTEGRALGLQKGSHTTRGQWAHQITAAALFTLLSQAFADYHRNTPADEQMHFDQWCKQMASEHPQFNYWYITLRLEIIFLQFMRSQREGNFSLYVESLGKIIPCKGLVGLRRHLSWRPHTVHEWLLCHSKIMSQILMFSSWSSSRATECNGEGWRWCDRHNWKWNRTAAMDGWWTRVGKAIEWIWSKKLPAAR